MSQFFTQARCTNASTWRGWRAITSSSIGSAALNPPSRTVVDAERAFLAELGGDCDLPAAAHAVLDDDDVVLSSLLAALDGSVVLTDDRRGLDGAALGSAAARTLLDAGGRDLLAAQQ